MIKFYILVYWIFTKFKYKIVSYAMQTITYRKCAYDVIICAYDVIMYEIVILHLCLQLFFLICSKILPFNYAINFVVIFFILTFLHLILIFFNKSVHKLFYRAQKIWWVMKIFFKLLYFTVFLVVLVHFLNKIFLFEYFANVFGK